MAGLLATLTGCGEQSAPGGEITLTMVAVEHGERSGNSSQRYWDKLIGEFRFHHPAINVDVDLYERGEIDARVAELVEAGKVPDLAQTTGAFAEYAQRDQLYSASEVLSTSTQASFIGSLVDAGTVSRIQYAMPFTASTRAFFYNKKLFTRAGIEEAPGSWKELRQAAVALRDSGVDTPYGLPLGRQQAEAEALDWMLGNDGSYTNDGGAYDIDSLQNVETFTWLRDELVAPGLTNASPATTDRDTVYGQFADGDVAMLHGHPGLVQQALEHGIDYGVAPLPGRTGPVTATTGVADWMMAFKQNGHAEQIRTFLDFVYRTKHVVEYADMHAMLPVTLDAEAAMLDDAQHKRLRPFLDVLTTARFYPLGKASWGDTVAKFSSTIGSAVVAKGDPRTVLGRVQRGAVAAEAQG